MSKVLIIKIIVGIVRIVLVIEWFLILGLFYNSETESFDLNYFQTEPYIAFVVLVILAGIAVLSHFGLEKLLKFKARISRELANQ